jgi:hypothetical protein
MLRIIYNRIRNSQLHVTFSCSEFLLANTICFQRRAPRFQRGDGAFARAQRKVEEGPEEEEGRLRPEVRRIVFFFLVSPAETETVDKMCRIKACLHT